MKKHTTLLIVFLAVIAFTAYSQIGNKNGTIQTANVKYTYCELVRQDVYFSGGSRHTIFLNFGANSTYQNRVAESNYDKSEKNGVDAINYMSENDWEVITSNVRDFSSSGIETVYLLRKIVH